MIVSGAVEGPVDDAVVRRLLRETGHVVGPIHIKNGKAPLLEKLHGYNAAAQIAPWLVLVDLNGDAPCAPVFVGKHLSEPADQMLFRVAVRQVESWLLADRPNFAHFLRVSKALLWNDPDSLVNSKRAVVDVAGKSSDRKVRQAMVPQPGSGRQVGPGYVARMIEFVELRWRIDEAEARSESLRRCLDRLRSL
jgi:hypothetical protein